MLAKAWRIYKIFETTPKIKKIVIKDLRLVVYIICMIMIDIIVLLVWHMVDTIRIKPRHVYETLSQPSQIIMPPSYTLKPIKRDNNLTDLSGLSTSSIIGSDETLNSNNNEPIIQNFSQTNLLKIVFECNSNYYEVWITILTMYKIILLMYGIYLAWIIRNINVPSMNDSKYLLLSTYTIIVAGLGSMTLMQVIIKDFFLCINKFLFSMRGLTDFHRIFS